MDLQDLWETTKGSRQVPVFHFLCLLSFICFIASFCLFVPSISFSHLYYSFFLSCFFFVPLVHLSTFPCFIINSATWHLSILAVVYLVPRRPVLQDHDCVSADSQCACQYLQQMSGWCFVTPCMLQACFPVYGFSVLRDMVLPIIYGHYGHYGPLSPLSLPFLFEFQVNIDHYKAFTQNLGKSNYNWQCFMT